MLTLLLLELMQFCFLCLCWEMRHVQMAVLHGECSSHDMGCQDLEQDLEQLKYFHMALLLFASGSAIVRCSSMNHVMVMQA